MLIELYSIWLASLNTTGYHAHLRVIWWSKCWYLIFLRDIILKYFWTNLVSWLKINEELGVLSGFPSCSAHHQDIKAWWVYVILPLQRRAVQSTLDSAAHMQNSPCRLVFLLDVLAVLAEMKSGGHLLPFD